MNPTPASPSNGSGFRARVALLLFGSGLCALVYQVAWLRLLRLIFGSSTASSAAVLAIFMGGLGLGSFVLGRRADRTGNPLGFYGNLELLISVGAALSPVIVLVVRATYVGLGGSQTLGDVGGTVVRLALAALVLGLPTFLMGGTLPAAVRSVTSRDDRGRRSLGLLYASNTVGAVVGASLTTFLLIEVLGVTKTVILAALVNALVAMTARSMARTQGSVEAVEDAAVPVEPTIAVGTGSPRLVFVAAGVVGFAFFLMELVWYRMLGPILGGSTYTFGLILVVALAGIGLGGFLYGMGPTDRRADLLSLAGSCALEGVLIMIPFALGDRVAYAANVFRDLQAFGFFGLVAGWTLIAGFVVLPAAVVAGYQFPLLVSILGDGRKDVGREVGQAYAWNTAGAILGSLAGGFGLLPLLGALGAWRLGAASLFGLALVCVVKSQRWRTARGSTPVVLVALGVVLLTTAGPGALWRHSGVGAGRFARVLGEPNDFLSEVNQLNSGVAWEADGRESSIAQLGHNGFAFAVNGKTDGHGRFDAPTQILSTLIGAVLQGDTRRGLVIGLGTGSSAGWLADVPSVERVDVVELEPVVARVAEDNRPVNRAALENPKLELIIGDGRELLLTMDGEYDLVFSEPSNPYRVGISSLFTQEFYEAVRDRLEPGGVFVQWLQQYEIDGDVVSTVYATLGSVFPYVETWEVHRGDLLLVSSMEPLAHDAARTRAIVESEPYRSAFRQVWGVDGLEGFYSGFLASHELGRRMAEANPDLVNTDDHPIIEYGFARNLGRQGLFTSAELYTRAMRWGAERPPGLFEDAASWDSVLDRRSSRSVLLDFPVPAVVLTGASTETGHRARARAAYLRSDFRAAVAAWDDQDEAPSHRADLLMLGESLAEVGDDRALEVADRLETVQPVEADAIRARVAMRQQRWPEAADALIRALEGYRSDPFPHPMTMNRAVKSAFTLARRHPEAGPRLYEGLEQPFSLQMLDRLRRSIRLALAEAIDFDRLCVEAFESFEPYPEWSVSFLERRAGCYRSAGHPLERSAAQDLARARSLEGTRLERFASDAAEPPAPMTGDEIRQAAGPPPSAEPPPGESDGLPPD